MVLALEQFVKNLEDSGIVSPSKIQSLLPPQSSPKTAEELARELVKQEQLTRFQAQAIYQGKAKSLILGSYTLLDKIGEGGMGQVFKAQHRRMDRIVAIKMLPAAMNKDAAMVARFEREAKAAAKLNHPNIVDAYDADFANDCHFLVMEYVAGSDLSALVKQHGPFPLAKALDYTLQAAKGLEYAHKKGVIHRDIKPGNLLLDGEGTIKILDMGLARIMSAKGAAAQAELTATGTVLGTVDYMAPEQAAGVHRADARADVYSLGCTLYYLLTGNAIYDGETVIEKLLAHRERPIPSLADVPAAVPEQIEAIFRKMVAKAVEDRYQSMSEAVAALQACVEGATTASGKSPPSAGAAADQQATAFLKQSSTNASPYEVTKPFHIAAGDAPKSRALFKTVAGIAGVCLLLGMIVFATVAKRAGDVSPLINGPTPAPSAPHDAAPEQLERQTVQWYLAKYKEPGSHGYLSLRVAGENKPFYSERDLPSGPFQIVGLGTSWTTDEDLLRIAQLPDLDNLDLTESPVTDQGLKHLKGLAPLQRLVLRGTKVTAKGVALLRKSLPTCNIGWSPTGKDTKTPPAP